MLLDMGEWRQGDAILFDWDELDMHHDLEFRYVSDASHVTNQPAGFPCDTTLMAEIMLGGNADAEHLVQYMSKNKV